MPKFIKGIHDFITFLTGKGQTGYHTPEEIDDAIHAASKSLFDEYRLKFQQTQIITDDIRPFIANPTGLTIDGSGQTPYPTLYCYGSTIRSGTKKVQLVDDSVLNDKINDPISPPTVDYPICSFYKDYIQFYPITGLASVKITYLKFPVKPTYAYTIEFERFVYDDDNSVDIEWGEQNHLEIIIRTLSYLGINLREQTMLQYSEMKKNQVL